MSEDERRNTMHPTSSRFTQICCIYVAASSERSANRMHREFSVDTRYDTIFLRALEADDMASLV